MSATRKINILIAAGGTGGHILPAVALGRTLEKMADVAVFYMCGARSVELDLYYREQITPVVVGVRQLGKTFAERMRGVAAAAHVTKQVFRFIVKNGIDAVIGMGGYVSGPAVLAGILSRRYTLIHEANSVAGRTNRWVAPWVNAVAVNFAATCSQLKSKQCKVVGMPIRDDVASGDRHQAYKHFELDPCKQTLLVLGGSQGALNLNRALLAALPYLDNSEMKNLQILWSAGASNCDEIKQCLERTHLSNLSIKLHPFIARMDLALAVADAAVSRAGASAIAELLACGVYTLYVPLPSAIYDHQRKNAQELIRAGLGLMVLENEIEPHYFADTIKALLAHAPLKRSEVARWGQIHRKAAVTLAEFIIEAVS